MNRISDDWDTDFSDDDASRFPDGRKMYRNRDPGPQARTNPGMSSDDVIEDQDEESENIYANGTELMSPNRAPLNQALTNSPSMVEQLREQLKLRKERRKPPTVGTKPKIMEKPPNVMERARNLKVFPPPQQPLPPKLDPEKPTTSTEVGQSIETPKKPQLKIYRLPPKPIDASRRILPEPPLNPPRMANFDIPTDSLRNEADDSEESDYEPVKGQTVKQGSAACMKTSLSTPSLASRQSFKSSNESVYHSSHSSPEDNEEVYETIPEKSTDRTQCMNRRPDRIDLTSAPLRPAPPRPSPTGSLRTPEKYMASPPIANQPSRPLPLPPRSPAVEKPVELPVTINVPNVPSYTTKPWFHNIGRREATALIRGASSTVSPDGYFLLRPAKAKTMQPYTLVLWHKDKTYNIAVRKRPDSRYALGTVKPNEMSFASIEEIVDYYKQEELIINDGDGDSQFRRTCLTETPPKRND